MGKYGLAKCPVFKEDGDVWETAPFGERRGTYTHKGVDIVRHIGCNTTATITAIADGTVIGVRTTVTGACRTLYFAFTTPTDANAVVITKNEEIK